MAAMGRPWPPKPEAKPPVLEAKRQEQPPESDCDNEVQFYSSRGALRHKRRLRELCEEHGVSLADVCGKRRFVKVCAARNQIISRMASEFPAKSLSLSQLGELIGGRHHTSILNSLIVTGCPERGYMEKGKRPRYSEAKTNGA